MPSCCSPERRYGRGIATDDPTTEDPTTDDPTTDDPTTALRTRFRALHAEGIFVMPNPWDAGSARRLAKLGFPALATTSSGHAASLGRRDQQVTRDELVAHAAALVAAVDVPLNVDAERCFAATPAGVGETVHLLAGTGAAGVSIEDYDPLAAVVEPLGVAVERVAAAAAATAAHGMVLTARAENHLYGAGDLADTIARLQAYRAAGADVVYAPGLADLPDIARLVAEVDAPVNVLALPHGPSVGELGSVGVRRVSTGGALAFAAYRAMEAAARELLESGTSTYAAR
ncbi:MAG TPA: isocitrate lyase/phosphoenolpyruvate mutase family protein [Acidimicrobiales bacterium]|nr:isocitrate lyase/phosphoenolpyruvate mutase family protein [Acidimicrobiales bacterium]